jgi:hypothetical protein
MRRYTLAQIAALARVDDASWRRCRSTAKRWRSPTFAPATRQSDYPSEAEWHARHLLESSRAIKCPTVAYPALRPQERCSRCSPIRAVLRRFVDDDATVARVLAVCAGLWALGDGRDQAMVDAAIADNCKHYVLKPQREGGGNNLYEADADRRAATHE